LKNRYLPEIKRLVVSYVEKVIVYEKHVDVVFKLPVEVLTYGCEGSIANPNLTFRRCQLTEANHRGSCRCGAPFASLRSAPTEPWVRPFVALHTITKDTS
jgi:hypothetical protein